MKYRRFLAAASAAAVLAGCATTQPSRVSQSDVDSLNAKVAALQASLSEKDAEIARLQNRMREEESARVQAESEKRALTQKLDSTLADLESAKRRKASSESDLK